MTGADLVWIVMAEMRSMLEKLEKELSNLELIMNGREDEVEGWFYLEEIFEEED